jgi:hypothetical protein
MAAAAGPRRTGAGAAPVLAWGSDMNAGMVTKPPQRIGPEQPASPRPPLLDQRLVLDVGEAAIELGLAACRDALLSGVDPRYVATLPAVSTPALQLISDLNGLSFTETLQDGSSPLETWLRTAYALTRSHRESQIFQRALTAVAEARAKPQAPGDGAAPAPRPAPPSAAPRRTEERLRILYLAANPRDTRQLQLEAEIREIRAKIRVAPLRDAVEFTPYLGVRPSDIEEALLLHRPQVVHYSGHGSRAGEIQFEDDARRMRPVGAATLATLFRILRDDVRVVVLNACHSRAHAEAVGQHIDFAVGMDGAIDDRMAIAFAAAFYRAIAYGRGVRTAFDLGVAEIGLEEPESVHLPRLVEGPGTAGLPDTPLLSPG